MVSFGIRILQWLGVSLALGLFAFSSDQLPLILINQNHTPAGIQQNGVLSLGLEISKGEWRPEADDGIALGVYAFGETGRPLQNPGPLIRVPQGTEIRVSLHNSLSVPIAVHGLGDPASDSVVHLSPEATEQVKFKPSTPGLYAYWGAAEVEDLKLRNGMDSELTGAIVVDPRGQSANDEIFVLEMMSERPGASARETLATINGKSWPYTQRFKYEIGQPVHWRWINATNEPHALHLHGFYYRVDAFNRGGHVETYSGDARPMVVTQRIAEGESFDMSWSPDRAGQWIFHCHMLQHMIPAIVPRVPGLAIQPAGNSGEMHDHTGMGQLVLGITVPAQATGPAPAEWHADHRLKLEISERTGPPRFAVQVHDSQSLADSGQPGLIGPPIILTRGQPTEIEVVNKLSSPTAIHWHGIELESYYDGVPGWSGADKQVTPPIAPGDSFVARMVPPRAGTFIYHTHWHDSLQLTNGLYGPLIVLPPSQTFDPLSDQVFVFSVGDLGQMGELVLINGAPQSKPLLLQAGKKYRFRLINITKNNQGLQVSLRSATGPVDWRVIARDGADLSAGLVHQSKAQMTITVGETYDVEFSSDVPQDLLLDVLRPALKMHTIQTLSFAAASNVGK